jgi:redox-sensitive bicupin YhaK (pirin superfamily)
VLKKLLMVAALSTAAVSAFAAYPAEEVQKAIPLKNGATVYILKDGKMAMEDKSGRAVRMKPGQVMETKDGQKIMMHGDEVMRLDNILHQDHRGG